MQVIEAGALDAWEAFSQRQSVAAEANQAGAHVVTAAGVGTDYLRRLPRLTRRLGGVVREAVVLPSVAAAESPLLGGEVMTSHLDA